MHMYIRTFFNTDPNFVDLEALKAIYRVHVHIKNNILFDQNMEVIGILMLYI